MAKKKLKEHQINIRSLVTFPDKEHPEIYQLVLRVADDVRRRATRHDCEHEVGYAFQDASYIDYIQDINAWGVFIQSEQKVPVGESILMTIPLLCNETSIKVVGQVVWSGPEGMGVRFSMGIGQTAVNAILGDKV